MSIESGGTSSSFKRNMIDHEVSLSELYGAEKEIVQLIPLTVL